MENKIRLIIFSLIIGLTIFSVGLFIDANHPTLASDAPDSVVLSTEGVTDEVVIKLYYNSQEQLNNVAGLLDVWEVHPAPGIGPNAGYAIAAVYPAQKDWLVLSGYRVEIDQEHTALLNMPTSALDPRYYYFDDYFTNPNGLYMVDFMQDTNTAYPDIVELIDIGDAWQSLHMGYHRDMLALRITNEDTAYGDIASKPPFILMANIHAREVSTPEMAIRYIKYLTSGYNGQGGYGVDPDVTWLVNHHVVYVVVSQNPDGRVKNEQNINEYWRKNADNDDGCSSSYGVDLNRNSSFKWGCCNGSTTDPCGETYRGPVRASEPETQAIQTLASQVFGDWNGPNGDDELPPAAPDNTPGIFISLHSYQDEILWSYESDQGGAPNNAQLTTIGHKLADITGVMIPTGFLYTVDGSTIDWVYGKLGIPGYTYEIGPTWGSCGNFFPAYGCQDGIDGMPRNFWAEMGPSFVYANKIAGSPYITSYGPDTKDLLVNPAEVPGGTPADLTGTVLDQRYSTDPLQPISAAEYFIDAPGADGTGIALSPADGAWGETNEPVEAVVDTSTLSQGQHYILVHGQNDDGVWGPYTAVFITITGPLAPLAEFTSNSPVELGQPVVFSNQTSGSEPLTFLWDFGDGIGTSTEISPTYTYASTGTYTVTLTATNPAGTNTITHAVSVLPVAITSVELTQLTTGPNFPGWVIDFSADLVPNNAGKPYQYTLDFGDGEIITGSSDADPMSFSHSYTHSGAYVVTISVMNDGMLNPITASLDIFISYINFMPLSLKH